MLSLPSPLYMCLVQLVLLCFCLSITFLVSMAPYMFCVLFFSATNSENKELNNVKNQLTGEFGGVPDTARYYKVTVASAILCV